MELIKIIEHSKKLLKILKQMKRYKNNVTKKWKNLSLDKPLANFKVYLLNILRKKKTIKILWKSVTIINKLIVLLLPQSQFFNNKGIKEWLKCIMALILWPLNLQSNLLRLDLQQMLTKMKEFRILCLILSSLKLQVYWWIELHHLRDKKKRWSKTWRQCLQWVFQLLLEP